MSLLLMFFCDDIPNHKQKFKLILSPYSNINYVISRAISCIRDCDISALNIQNVTILNTKTALHCSKHKKDHLSRCVNRLGTKFVLDI